MDSAELNRFSWRCIAAINDDDLEYARFLCDQAVRTAGRMERILIYSIRRRLRPNQYGKLKYAIALCEQLADGRYAKESELERTAVYLTGKLLSDIGTMPNDGKPHSNPRKG